ncbi:PAS domain-containing protein [Sphingomonas japonica]|uniref:histidine kinase n=1 Tax=Sphingomonas japonica TaxID=511662 RepID=A0ABX0TYR5_9SPHN|nr:PAS domain-containing protein [Sphingomonas japonica]NIJ23459.1 PAS domain S-box-containing protein [Sphingomonas japonica]
MHSGLSFLDHRGEMAERIRHHDWSKNPLGPLDSWPQALRFAVNLCLGSGHPTAIYWGPDLRLVYNDAWAPIPAERHPWALGQPGAEVFAEIWDIVGPQLDQLMATGVSTASYDQRLDIVRDGVPREAYWNYSLSPIRDEYGVIVGAFNQGNDVTQRVLAERARRLSEERLQLALGASHGVGTWDWDIVADQVTADSRFARMYGVDPDLAEHGAPLEMFFGRIHSDDAVRVEGEITRSIGEGLPFASEYRLVQEDGSVRWVAAEGRVSYAEDGTALRLPGVTFDITNRRRAEDQARAVAEELRKANESQTFLYSLAERQRGLDNPQAIMRFTATALGRRLEVDRLGFYRVAPDETVEFGPCWTSGALPPMRGSFHASTLGEAAHRRYRAGRTLVLGDTRGDADHAETGISKHSAAAIGVPLLRHGRWVGSLYANQAEQRAWTEEEVAFLEAVAEITWDAIERVEAVAALQESEEKFRAIANSIDPMVWSTRPDGFHDYYNDRWYEFTGVPHGSTDGAGWNGMFHPEDQERAWAQWQHCLASGERYHIEYRLRHHSGHYRWVLGRAQAVRDEGGRITRWFGTCTDIQDIVEAREVLARSRAELEAAVSERTQQLMAAEEQLRQAQKMEAVGQLTGGIAHDFNNMLAVVIGALDLLERRLRQGSTDVDRYVLAARDGATRAAALTQRLLAFARQTPLAPSVIDVNAMVLGMIDLVNRTIGDDVRVETQLAADLAPAMADPSQLENVILNLSVNARDAMPRGGVLTIATAMAAMSEADRVGMGLAPGHYILVTVSDTGAGMAPDVAARAFEPFFTTKGVGKGTGLGLSQVFGFVRQSGGHVRLDSEAGHGTTVTLYLPASSGAAAAPQSDPVRRETLPRGASDEVVMVVEDEERVRNFSVEALRELGYTVVHTAHGAEALAMIEAGQGISLLFTDVIMPEMTGRELADRAGAAIPGLRVLYTSGYTRDIVDDMSSQGSVLAKPFDLARLAHRVRAALDE